MRQGSYNPAIAEIGEEIVKSVLSRVDFVYAGLAFIILFNIY